jgi:hypothetical protein
MIGWLLPNNVNRCYVSHRFGIDTELEKQGNFCAIWSNTLAVRKNFQFWSVALFYAGYFKKANRKKSLKTHEYLNAHTIPLELTQMLFLFL